LDLAGKLAKFTFGAGRLRWSHFIVFIVVTDG
jgi:hypothetical protein